MASHMQRMERGGLQFQFRDQRATAAPSATQHPQGHGLGSGMGLLVSKRKFSFFFSNVFHMQVKFLLLFSIIIFVITLKSVILISLCPFTITLHLSQYQILQVRCIVTVF